MRKKPREVKLALAMTLAWCASIVWKILGAIPLFVALAPHTRTPGAMAAVPLMVIIAVYLLPLIPLGLLLLAAAWTTWLGKPAGRVLHLILGWLSILFSIPVLSYAWLYYTTIGPVPRNDRRGNDGDVGFGFYAGLLALLMIAYGIVLIWSMTRRKVRSYFLGGHPASL